MEAVTKETIANVFDLQKRLPSYIDGQVAFLGFLAGGFFQDDRCYHNDQGGIKSLRIEDGELKVEFAWTLAKNGEGRWVKEGAKPHSVALSLGCVQKEPEEGVFCLCDGSSAYVLLPKNCYYNGYWKNYDFSRDPAPERDRRPRW